MFGDLAVFTVFLYVVIFEVVMKITRGEKVGWALHMGGSDLHAIIKGTLETHMVPDLMSILPGIGRRLLRSL